MAANIKPSEALRRDPHFFTRRPPDFYWTLKINHPDGRIEELLAVDWVATSRFGKVYNAVMVDAEGSLLYDRPVADLAPGVAAVVWGRCPNTGEIKIALLSQEFSGPHDPENSSSTLPIKLLQVPAGYKDNERGVDAIVREVKEETGCYSILNLSKPEYPYANASASFQVNWVEFYFVEVDLSDARNKPDASEGIAGVEFVGVRQLLAMIREGKVASGIFRDTFTLGLLMVFFSNHPEFWVSKE